MSSLNSMKKYLENLSMSNQEKFLKLIIKNNIPFSENKNGSFINISELNLSQLSIIKQFIDLLEIEEHTFNQVEKTKLDLKNLIDSSSDNNNNNNDSHYSPQYDLNIS